MNKLNQFFAAALLGSVGVAHATVIDFNSAPDQYFIPSYSEAGFVMTLAHADGLGTLLGNDGYWTGNGTSHLMSWSNVGEVSGFVLARQDGEKFSLSAFEFGNGYVAGNNNPASFVITGTTGTGDTVTATIDHSSLGAYTHTFGSGWGNLSSVNFAAYGFNNRATYDNIVVGAPTAVPEPAAIALMLGGVAVVGLARARKSKAA